MLKGEYKNFPFGSKMEKLVTKIENYSIIKAIEDYDVIVDSTGFRFNPDTLKKHPTLGHKIDFIVEEVDFTHVDLKTCIQRDQQREFPVGKEVIERMYNKYLKK